MSDDLPPDTVLLATVEAAHAIGVERSVLSRWIDSGRITPAMRLPGQTGAYLFTLDEVERVKAEYAAVQSGAWAAARDLRRAADRLEQIVDRPTVDKDAVLTHLRDSLAHTITVCTTLLASQEETR